MTQERKELPIPSLTAEQVKFIIDFANEQLPTKYGKEILSFIERVAIDLDRQQNQPKKEDVKAS